MLNLPETFFLSLPYPSQSSVLLKIIGLLVGAPKFLEFVRFQVAEIVLLQLMPGVYFSLVFFSFVFLFYISFNFLKLIKGNDWKKKLGTKIFLRLLYRRVIRSTFFYFSVGFFVFFNEIIPITFESFSLIDTYTFANLWELGEFVGIEATLSFLLFNITQFPLTLIGNEYNSIQFSISPTYIRDYLFGLSLGAGFLTPTLDVATQINFILIGIGFYLIISYLVEKITKRRNFSKQ